MNAITVIKQGHCRAAVTVGHAKLRFISVDGGLYCKRPGDKRINDGHAVLSMAGGCGVPFEVQPGETCAQALARFYATQGHAAQIVTAY